jgi:hypothetical protein
VGLCWTLTGFASLPRGVLLNVERLQLASGGRALAFERLRLTSSEAGSGLEPQSPEGPQAAWPLVPRLLSQESSGSF